jgi:exosortase/archaeosortase family protein
MKLIKLGDRFEKYQANLLFLFKFALLFVLWKMFFFLTWRVPEMLDWYNSVSLDVIAVLVDCAYWLMTALGESMEVDSELRIVRIIGTNGVTVGEPCIGYEVNAIFIALILSTQGKLMQKLLFLIGGLFVLVFLNVARISALAYLVEINPWLWEVNHKFIFSIVIYSVLFGLWHLWLKYTSSRTEKADNIKIGEVDQPRVVS